MRILFLCHRIPFPPDKGDKIRAFHQLRAIAARHEVDVFTLADDPRDLEHHQQALATHCRHLTVARIVPALARLRSLPYLLTRTPLTIPYFYSADLQKKISKAVAERKYDRIFVYCSAMAQYVPWNQAGPRVPVVMDLVDVDSDKWTQYAAATAFPFSIIFRREARNLRAYERKVCQQADCVVVTTRREAALARQIAPAVRVHVVPMGVDTAYFTPSQITSDNAAPSIVFTGDMGYFPNQHGVTFFAREVLPLIRRQIPTARFVVVGRNPDRRVRQLRAIDGVEVTGWVPDVRPWLAQASVAVAPLMIAAGLQNKILEAMASGLPIVATPRAIQGLTPGVAACVETGDRAETLAAKVVAFLLDPQLARDRGLEGRRRVAADYSWDDALEQLLHLIDDPTRAQSQEDQPAHIDPCVVSA